MADGAVGPQGGDAPRQSLELTRLKAEDTHATNRLALYRAKMYGRPGDTMDGDTRLRELERLREGTRRRLREAIAAQKTGRQASG